MTTFAVVLLSLTLAAQGQDPRAEAERLARAGKHVEALELYQKVAAANPDDIEARLAIGRLHGELGHPRRAAAVYESIVAAAPQNVEALLGLAVSQMDAGHFEEAASALSRAEALAGDRVDVLAAQGRYHAAQGRATLALAYYDRALVTAPDNAEVRAGSDAVRASRAHRVSLGYDFQKVDRFSEGMHAGTLDVNLRLHDRFRVFARGQMTRFEEWDEGRGGGGFEWRAHRLLEFRAGALAGNDNIFLPSTDLFAEARVLRPRSRWTVAVRYFEFDGADLWIGGPGFEFDVTPEVTLLAQYLVGRTRIEFGDSSTSNNGMVGIAAAFSDRVRGSVEYHRGIDHLDWLTVDRLLAERANTFSASIGADLTPFVTVSAAFDHSDRPSFLGNVNRGRGWLTFRF